MKNLGYGEGGDIVHLQSSAVHVCRTNDLHTAEQEAKLLCVETKTQQSQNALLKKKKKNLR